MGHVAENVEKVKKRIAEAAARSGRDPGAVRLIAVSKTKPVSDMLDAYADGVRDFGENYVQELTEKRPLLPDDVRLHFIGHLQTNKAGKTLDCACMIHSVDSLHLAAELEKQAAKRGLQAFPILLEVNIAEEDSKFGFSSAETLPAVLEIAKRCPHLCVRGLMTSAPITEDAETNRVYFAAMRKLLEAANRMIEQDEAGVFRAAGTGPLSELSMGMTGDYIVAVEEGATMVRVGTAIFGARNYHKE